MPALPSASSFTGSGVTEADFKTQLTNLISYLSGLLDTPGTAIRALQKLGALANAVLSKSAAYTVVAADRGKLIDCSGTWTLSLTAAATLGSFAFAVRNSGSGTITIDPDLSEQIDGATTITLAPGESCIVVCDGSAFKSIGKSTGYTAGDNITISGNVISAGGWRQVGNPVAVTAVSSIDFDLQEDIYAAWMFVGSSIKPATDNNCLRMLPGYNSGGTFETAAPTSDNLGSGIDYATHTWTISGGLSGGASTQGIGNAAGEGTNFVVTIAALGSTLSGGITVEARTSWVDADNVSRAAIVRHVYTGSTERLWDAVRFLWKSGNFSAQGTITMYALPR